MEYMPWPGRVPLRSKPEPPTRRAVNGDLRGLVRQGQQEHRGNHDCAAVTLTASASHGGTTQGYRSLVITGLVCQHAGPRLEAGLPTLTLCALRQR